MPERPSRGHALQPPGVLLVCLAKGFGGAETRVLQTATALAGKRPCGVATLAGSELARRLRDRGLEPIELDRSRADPRLLLDLVRICRRRNIQVVDAHNPQSQLWGLLAAAIAGVPGRLASVHHVYGTTDGPPGKARFYEAILRLQRRLGCDFMSISQEITADLGRLGIARERLHVSRNGIDVADLPAAHAQGLRETLGLPPRACIALHVGRLVPLKGQRFLLHALATLRDEMPDLHVALVGEGPERGTLERIADQLGIAGRVHFLGFRQDAAALMREADILVLCSLHEGLPYVLLEAALVGVPILASPVGDIAHHFEDGRTAFFTLPDATSVAAGLRRMRNDPITMAQVAEAARVLVRERFGLERMIAETDAIYDSLVPWASAELVPQRG